MKIISSILKLVIIAIAFHACGREEQRKQGAEPMNIEPIQYVQGVTTK